VEAGRVEVDQGGVEMSGKEWKGVERSEKNGKERGGVYCSFGRKALVGACHISVPQRRPFFPDLNVDTVVV
jgi:hypothetical protein